MNESPHIRVSAADRERAMTELAHHFSTGRISLAEFDARSIQVLHAENHDQLADLFTDLPAPPGQPPEDRSADWPFHLLVRAAAATAVGLFFWFAFGHTMWLPLVGCALVGVAVWVSSR
ncbi:DUF1707 SHOCT-like domain-containing protein [Nocardia tengchongensis]|uniref:DUF1707 SHOCT-like domain-containing protein n=1 Tax=Nocardia tengchongensis TaxID=2055889 RepID=UPI00367BE461